MQTISTSQDNDGQVEFDLSKSDCTESERQLLHTLLQSHAKAFVSSNGQLGFCPFVEHKITLKQDAEPICKMPYRYSPEVTAQLSKQIEYLLQQGVIKEHDVIVWCSPVLAVKKATKKSQKHLQRANMPNEYRLCLDLRNLNKATSVTKYSMATLGSMLDILGSKAKKYFTSLDMKDGYFQLALEKSSQPYTGFMWQGRNYCFKRAAMGYLGHHLHSQNSWRLYFDHI